MHIVFLAPTFDTPAPRNIRARHIAQLLSKQHEITIICFDSLHAEKWFHESLTIKRVPYSWVSKYITNKTDSGYKPRGLKRFISRACSLALNSIVLFPDPWILESKKIVNAITSLPSPPDVVIASAKPYSMAEIANLYRKSHNRSARVILDIGDPLANNQTDKSVLRKNRQVKYESQFLAQADHAIVTNQATRSYYIEQYNLPKQKISVIAQGGVTTQRSNSNKQPESTKSVRIIYAGAFINKLRDPRRLMAQLKNFTGKVELDVYGALDTEFTSGFDHIQYYGRVAHEQLDIAYTDAHCLLFVDNAYGIQTSGKIFELLSLKMPIFFLYDNENSTVKIDCENYDHILFVKNTEADIKKALEKLRVFLNSNHSYDYDTNQFSWENRAKQFDRIVSEISLR